MRTKKILIAILAFVSFISAIYFATQISSYIKEAAHQREVLRQRRLAWGELKEKLTNEISKFKGDIGIVVKDFKAGWELSYNKRKLFPSASLAKVPIMPACYLAAKDGLINLDSEIELKSSDKIGGSGILKNTQSGTKFSINEIIGFMITYSDNTATHILTNMLGLEYLEGAFTSFGLNNTNLSRKVADYRSRDKGIENYTTAEDMAIILEKMYRKKLVSKEVSEQCLNILKIQHYNDRIPKYLPVNVITAHKTGLEKNVCHDVGIVFTPKGDFLIAVLVRHDNKSAVLAKKFIAKAALLTYKYFDSLE